MKKFADYMAVGGTDLAVELEGRLVAAIENGVQITIDTADAMFLLHNMVGHSAVWMAAQAIGVETPLKEVTVQVAGGHLDEIMPDWREMARPS